MQKKEELHQMSFWKITAKLFHRKRVCVYTVFDHQDLFRITGLLQDADIPYQTRIPGLIGGINGVNPPAAGSDFNEYQIYVKREDEERARFVLGV